MKNFWGSCVIFVGVMIFALAGAGRAQADEWGQAQITELKRNLHLTNQDKDYNKLTEWVFEKGITQGELRRRVDKGMWVLNSDTKDEWRRYSDLAHARGDSFIARLLEEAEDCWWSWMVAGDLLQKLEGGGRMRDGKFVRNTRWAVSTHHAGKRDQARVRQYFHQSMRLAQKALKQGAATQDDLAQVYLKLSDQLQSVDDPELLALSDFATLPDIKVSSRFVSRSYQIDGHSPMIGSDGKLRWPKLPKSFDGAGSDMERIYWLLSEAKRISPLHTFEARYDLATFWAGLLGVDRLSSADYVYVEGTESEKDPEAAGELDLRNLKYKESILVGVDGPERVTLPDEFDYLGILHGLVDNEATSAEFFQKAVDELFVLLCNRQKYTEAQTLAESAFKDKRSGDLKEDLSWRLRSIGPDASFIPVDPVPVNREAEVVMMSRQISQQKMVLWKLDVGKYLRVAQTERGDDVEDMIFWSRSARIGEKNVKKYRDLLDGFFVRAAEWNQELEKKPNHRQTHTRIKVPVNGVGRYLLECPIGDEIILQPVCVYRAMILSVAMEGSANLQGHYFVLDATTGLPAKNINIEVPKISGFNVEDSEDPVLFSRPDHNGYLAGMKSTGVYLSKFSDEAAELHNLEHDRYLDALDGDKVESFFVTNQPLYRPGQKVGFAGWLKRPHHHKVNEGGFPPETQVRVKVVDPVGLVLYKKELPMDKFGGFTGGFQLGSEIVLGSCQVELAHSEMVDESDDPFGESKMVQRWRDFGSSWNPYQWSIEVGEFRKPDFQVEVQADTAGEKIAATIIAKYHSGDPVVGAKVSATLDNYPYDALFFPSGEWDGLYGEGYQWCLPRPAWIKGWRSWAIYQENYDDDDYSSRDNGETMKVQGVTDAQGKVHLEMPEKLSLIGKADLDCSLRVGVQEFTGRTVNGGEDFVYSGRKFEVFAKPGKGFYRAGEEIEVELRTMDSKGGAVAGAGEFRVERILEKGRVMVPVLKRSVKLGDHGIGSEKFTLPDAGQYRCIFNGGGRDRGFVMEVTGERKQLGTYDGVQLIPSKSVATPGDVIEVLVLTQQESATVWLFQLMPNGRWQTPRLVHTKNQMAIVDVAVDRSGIPDFYLQASTVLAGRHKQAQCRIILPPVDSVLDLEMTAQPETGKPGERAEVSIRVKDAHGKPALVSLAVTAYDKSLEGLSEVLPDAGSLRDYFEIYDDHPSTSMDGERRDRLIFVRLEQEGCFYETGDLIGELRPQKKSRFVRYGDGIWINYSPPELPNSVGSPTASGVFPVTPASPVAGYYRPRATVEKMSKIDRAQMDKLTMRKRFADRAYWGTALKTDADGRVKLGFDFPDNLTAWRVKSWAFGKGQQFGDAELEIPVSKSLQVRALMPRSAVVGDIFTMGAQIQNRTDVGQDVQMVLEVEGGKIEGEVARKLHLDAGQEGKAEWQVRVDAKGTAQFRIKARNTDGTLQDGVEMPLPVAAYRVPVTAVKNGELTKGVKRVHHHFDRAVSAENVRMTTRVQAEPGLGALMVLPDLICYPYGCTEQTLNKFLPLVISWNTTKKLDLDWKTMQKVIVRQDRPLGWIKGRAQGEVSATGLDLTEKKMRGMIFAGLNRLSDLQSSEGRWGWFSSADSDSHVYLTALAVRGLAKAKKAGFVLPNDPGSDGVSYLNQWAGRRVQLLKKSPDQVELQDAFVCYVLKESTEKSNPELEKILQKSVNELSLSGMIYLALAMDEAKNPKGFARVVAAVRKRMTQLRGGPEEAGGYRWNNRTEVNAWYLKLLLKSGANKNEIRGEVKRLLGRRYDGVHWSSTKDSALSLEVVMEAALACGMEVDANKKITATVELSGQKHDVILSVENLWTSSVSSVVKRPSRKEVSVVAESDVPLEVISTVQFKSDTPEHFQKKSHGIEVTRQYYRRDEKGLRKELQEGEFLHPGDLIEVELSMETKNEARFVHLRDPIPAGLEPLVQLSGYEGGCYRESRTGEAHFFLTRLSAWNGKQSYWLRAVTAGTTISLPARAECMYAPEIYGQSGLLRIQVVEKK